jgi:hypothetical protein
LKDVLLGRPLSKIEKPSKRLYWLWMASMLGCIAAIEFAFISNTLHWTSFGFWLELNRLAIVTEAVVSGCILAAWVLPPVLKVRREKHSVSTQ